MNLYTATIDGKEQFGIVDENNDFNYTENGYLFSRKVYSNLAPVRVVPKDGGVRIEGEIFDLRETLNFAARNISNFNHANKTWFEGMFQKVIDLAKSVEKQYQSQLTPLREEPKGFGAIVEAGNVGARVKWIRTMARGERIWMLQDGTGWADYSDLINPVIISEDITPKETGE